MINMLTVSLVLWLSVFVSHQMFDRYQYIVERLYIPKCRAEKDAL